MPQTQIYAKKAQVHVVVESTVDTYVAPSGSGTGMFLAENISYSVSGDNYVPSYVRGDFLSMDESPGMLSATIAFEVPIKGSGTAGTAPDWGVCMKACGFKETTVAVTSVSYTPHSVFDGSSGNPGQSYSVSLLINGIRYSLKGGFGNVAISCPVGQPAKLKFNFQGAYNAFADDGLEAPTYNTTKAPSFLGATFATNFGGSYSPKGIENLEFDTGNIITLGRDANDSAGIYGARIVGRKSTGSFDPEATLAATNNFWSAQRAGTTGTINTGTVGSTAGNRWALAISRAILRPIGTSDRNGIAALSIPFGVSSAATDVEGTNADVTLTLT